MACKCLLLFFLSWTSDRLQGETFLSKGCLPRSALDPALLPLFLSPSSSKASCPNTSSLSPAVSFPRPHLHNCPEQPGM